ncbi:PDZ domain-containing protein GIPC1-like [Copidosoma floridanum]|nr:PDZ domain-containing protein GIPC1-like [Copidosoma floridanum]
MGQLIGGQIGLDDFIFAHKKGRAKEVELIKTEPALGLTLTDNGAGFVFIKRIRDNSIMDKLGVVQIGDHLEKLNGASLVGKRHFEVARMLKEIECGSSMLLRLVEPASRTTGFGPIGLRAAGPRSRAKFAGYPTGWETLRFKADGFARIEQLNETDKAREQIEKINNALDVYMGISDYVLARRLWEIAQKKINSMDLAKAMDSALPDSYDFPKDFIFDVWKIAFETRKNP